MEKKTDLKKIAVKVFTTAALSFGVLVGGVLPSHAAVVEEQRPISGLPVMYSSNEFIVAHEAANPNNVGANSLDNEVGFMSNNWGIAYTTDFVGSGGRAIQLAPHGRACWGAGGAMNGRAYAQVELARTNDPNTFKKDYSTYVSLLRQLAAEAGLPYSRIVSHEWVSNNLGGTDHNDPYNYLSQWGISRAQFQNDLLNGINGGRVTPTPLKPSVVKPVNPSQPEKPSNGSYTASGVQNIRDAAGMNGGVVGQYEAGQSFNYDGKVQKEGYTWLTYISYSGQRRYVADLSQQAMLANEPTTFNQKDDYNWVKEDGFFHPNTSINVRSEANTNSAKVAEYQSGQVVRYDSKKVSGGYVWVHYVSYSGQNRYMAVRSVTNGVRGSLWGYID